VGTQIFRPERRDAISRFRRHPDHCLYCECPPDSTEHPLAEALGGRLSAKILCSRHNAEVAHYADEPMIVQLQPLAHFLNVRRQRGKRGSEFRAKMDDGRHVRVSPQGQVRRPRIEVTERTSQGKIKRATGDLSALDQLQSRGALDAESGRILAFAEKSPQVTLEIKLSDDVYRGALKTAFHFVAAFVTDVPDRIAQGLLPYITGEKEAAGEYVRAITLGGEFFPTSLPPRHQIAVYCEGSEIYVTVLLFSLHAFQVRLPIENANALRYIQPLIDSFDPILEENDHVRTFTWEDRLTDDNWDAYVVNLRARHEHMMNFMDHRHLRERCKRAAGHASDLFLRGQITPFEAYRAGLQREAFTANQITILIAYGQKLHSLGMDVWDLPIDIMYA